MPSSCWPGSSSVERLFPRRDRLGAARTRPPTPSTARRAADRRPGGRMPARGFSRLPPAADNNAMPEAQLVDLAAEVARFERWHYQFDLGGVRTPIFDPDHVRRHAERRAYFFEPL